MSVIYHRETSLTSTSYQEGTGVRLRVGQGGIVNRRLGLKDVVVSLPTVISVGEGTASSTVPPLVLYQRLISEDSSLICPLGPETSLFDVKGR